MQRLLFRQLGDVSLYVAGFFQDSFAKKLVDIDYYIDMGGTAYHHVAVRADRPPVQQMFHELAGRFGALVDVESFHHYADPEAVAAELEDRFPEFIGRAFGRP